MKYFWAAIATILALGMLGGIAWLVVRLVNRRHPKAAASVGLGGLLAIVAAVFSIANDSFFNTLEAVGNSDSKQSPGLTPMSPGSATSGGSSSASSGSSNPSAVPSPGTSSNAGPAADASQLPTSTAETSIHANPAPAAPATNVVRFGDVSGAGNQVVAIVEVGSPPEAGRHYILVARFDKPPRYDMKAHISETKGVHQIQVDLGEAPEGSWRDFAVLAVSSSEIAKWQTTLDVKSLADNPGGKVVAGWRPYQR